MNPSALTHLALELLFVLTSGLVAGWLCKRWGVSLLVGYLLVGAVIGEGGLQLVSQRGIEFQLLAEAGALFLLFAVGLEFSLDELQRMSRYFFVGGTVQMVLVAVPLTAVAHSYGGMSWKAAILAGSAGALSSTVLVFKALAESGQLTSPAGRRALGILLFQDVALVPLMLLVPLLTGHGAPPTLAAYELLAAKSATFVLVTAGLHFVVGRWAVPALARLRSVELVVLFALVSLCGLSWGAHALGLPAALGALAAGLVLSGNRLTKQIDTIVLPYRESFAAVFFVTLGMLLHPLQFLAEPLRIVAGLAGMLVLKTTAAWLALRVVGLPNRAAWGMGLGLSQLGEFSFLLISLGVAEGLITVQDFDRMLFIALGTLVLTPGLLRVGLRWTGTSPDETMALPAPPGESEQDRAVVIGIGPIGRRVASHLETTGVAVGLVDLSPVNLYPFAQQGFATVAGDSRERDVLLRIGVDKCRLAVICVPDDEVAAAVVTAVRDLNAKATVLVRCRFESNARGLQKAGATVVVSEEAEASGRLLQWCQRAMETAGN